MAGALMNAWLHNIEHCQYPSYGSGRVVLNVTEDETGTVDGGYYDDGAIE
jgi:hypothetical protein